MQWHITISERKLNVNTQSIKLKFSPTLPFVLGYREAVSVSNVFKAKYSVIVIQEKVVCIKFPQSFIKLYFFLNILQIILARYDKIYDCKIFANC